jgi:FixJ family two-component response regulator
MQYMGGRLRIAIVDDEEPVRRALRRLFLAEGMEADTFASGSDFLESLGSRHPDCLVLDLHLPGLDGFALQRQLTEAYPRVPVVVITGHDPEGADERVRAAGAVAYLLKPLEAPTLLAAVASAIEAARSPKDRG